MSIRIVPVVPRFSCKSFVYDFKCKNKPLKNVHLFMVKSKGLTGESTYYEYQNQSPA